jgi:hypothetical protein
MRGVVCDVKRLALTAWHRGHSDAERAVDYVAHRGVT